MFFICLFRNNSLFFNLIWGKKGPNEIVDYRLSQPQNKHLYFPLMFNYYIMDKTCKKCNRILPIENFRIGVYNGNKIIRNECKDCKNKQAKKYYQPPTEEQREIRREYTQLKAKENGGWISLSRKKEMVWTDQEYTFNIKEAHKLKKNKLYFKYCHFEPSDMVADAYIRLIERELPYSRHQFYLLMWQAMSKAKYLQIKLSPQEYERLLLQGRERLAVARFLLKKQYINIRIKTRGLNIKDLSKEELEKYKKELNLKRKNKKLLGEFYLKRDNLIE